MICHSQAKKLEQKHIRAEGTPRVCNKGCEREATNAMQICVLGPFGLFHTPKGLSLEDMTLRCHSVPVGQGSQKEGQTM
jgi:hypothetical protein